MEDLGVKSISDEDILNFAIRDGGPNPHSSLGYLMHPSVVKAIKDWIDE